MPEQNVNSLQGPLITIEEDVIGENAADEDGASQQVAKKADADVNAKDVADNVVAGGVRVSLEGFGEAWTARGCRFTPPKLRCVAWKLMSACGACSA